MAEREKLIELKDLQITFGSGKKKFVAVDHVNFDIYKGETFSLVGESGSGKTTIGRAICRINPTSGGDIFFKGQKINGKISKELDREVIRKIQMIFQDPMASLNERAKVEYIIAEGLLNHHLYKDQEDLHEKVMNALHEVGLLPEFASRFPHEFSGGQRQRIGIARALVMEPEFIVADEPISALDVSIRAQVLNLLNEMKKSRGLTYLFIAHDLSVVRFISDRIAVISKGRIVELAEAEELFLHPLHPYTEALFSAIPVPDPDYKMNRIILQGSIPSPSNPPAGCKFHTRCSKCMEVCKYCAPDFREVEPGHFCACHLYDEAPRQAEFEAEMRELKQNEKKSEKKSEKKDK